MKKLAVGLVVVLMALGLSSTGLLAQGGQLQLPTISVTPSSHDFGTVPVGALATVRLTVTNSGDLPLNVSNVKTKAPFNDNATSFTLQGHESREVLVSFAPTAAIQYSGACSFISNAHNAPSLNIPLTGWGQ